MGKNKRSVQAEIRRKQNRINWMKNNADKVGVEKIKLLEKELRELLVKANQPKEPAFSSDLFAALSNDNNFSPDPIEITSRDDSLDLKNTPIPIPISITQSSTYNPDDYQIIFPENHRRSSSKIKKTYLNIT